MSSSLYRSIGLFLLFSIAELVVGAQEPLTLRQAIDVALGKGPQAAIAHADNLEAKSAASLARAQLLPQFRFTEDISRGDDPVFAFGTRLRQRQFSQADFALNALNSPQPIGNFSTRFSGQWVAFDSFKTQKEIHRADLLMESVSSSVDAVNQQIVFRVVGAYQQVLYAQRTIAVAEHEQETAEALLTSVEEHVKAGLAVQSDQMLAQVNAAARKDELIAAEGDLELAWASLREAMGSPEFKATSLRPIEPHSFPQGVLEKEIATAAKMRPDLTALGQAQSAQASAVGAAKSDFGPRVSAYGNWEDDRTSFGGSGGNNWVAGMQVSVDILPIGKRAQLASESAAKQKIDAQVVAAEQHLRLEVSQAHIRHQTAALQLDTAQAAVNESAESLRIVKSRYTAGLATITDLLRAEDAERQSQSNYWHAVYANAMAYSELLYATGTLSPDVAEELQ
jgi:outer membrane protein TolC